MNVDRSVTVKRYFLLTRKWGNYSQLYMGSVVVNI